jgi:hypothetical protein
MRRSSSAGLPVALVASVVLHVAAAALAIAPRALAAPDSPPPDVWAGTSVELLTESELPTPSVAGAPSEPSSPGSQGETAEPPAPPTPEDAAEPAPRPKPKEPKAKEPKAKEPKAKEPKAKEPKAKEPKAKEPKEPKPADKQADGEPPKAPAVPPEEKPEEAHEAAGRRGLRLLPSGFRVPKRVTPTRSVRSAVEEEKRKEAKNSKGAEAPGAGEAARPAASAVPAGGSFGAVGAAQVRDLGSSFTRAIAPAGQPDLTWGSLPTGDAGTLDVALDVDEEGKITGFTPRSAAPPTQLVGLVKRVLAVLRSGHFSIRGPAASAGVQVLRISAKTSDLVDPGLIQGGLVQLAFTFENGKGHSSFTQVTGRHVEVNVEVRKVEVAGAK